MTGAALILGAGGFIGRALTESLSGLGIPVIAVGTSLADAQHPLVECLPAKVDGTEQLASLLARSDRVVHLATVSTSGTSTAKPLQEIERNLGEYLELVPAAICSVSPLAWA